MTLRLFTLLFLGACFQFIHAQDTITSSNVAAETVDTTENALLWRIESSDLENPSYLFGTIHLIPEADFFLSDSTLSAFNRSSTVFFEIDLEETMDFGVMMKLMMDAIMKDGTTIKDLVSAEDYQMISDHFAELGLPMMMVNNIKPMFLTVLAGGDFDMTGGDSEDAMVSYELKLWEMSDGKEIEGLETAEFQMSVFDSIPYKIQADMLVQSIKSEGDPSAWNDMDYLVKLYKSQRIHRMQELLSEDTESLADFEDILIDKRNAKWIGEIEKNIQASTCFFAVGAGHLGGPKGVVHLLRKQGYTLTPIP